MNRVSDEILIENGQAGAFIGGSSHVELCAIVVSYNTHALLTRCIDSLRRSCAGISARVIIVDNASRDGSVAIAKQNCPDCVLVENQRNVGFGRANNQVLNLCHADFVLLLNPDAFVGQDTISKCLAHMRSHPECGILGVNLFDESGWSGGNPARTFPTLWRNFAVRTGLRKPVGPPVDTAEFVDCDWVTGCFYLVRKELLAELGLFDPRYFLYFEEVDHCMAARRAGWKVQCLRTTSVVHVGGASALSEGELTRAGRQLSDLQIESELLYFRKQTGRIGALASVALGLLANLILAAKWIAKGRPPAQLAAYWQNSCDVVRIARQSGFGARPSR